MYIEMYNIYIFSYIVYISLSYITEHLYLRQVQLLSNFYY